MSDFLKAGFYLKQIFPFFYRQCVQMYDMDDKSKTKASFLSFFRHILQHPGCSLQRNKTAQEASQTSQWCCHATINKKMTPYMTQCKDPEIINHSKTLLHHNSALAFTGILSQKASSAVHYWWSLNWMCLCSFHRWTQGVCLPYMERSGEWWGRGAGMGDSPLSHHAAGDSSITLRGAASIINK